jgi:hypothetical protein
MFAKVKKIQPDNIQHETQSTRAGIFSSLKHVMTMAIHSSAAASLYSFSFVVKTR